MNTSGAEVVNPSFHPGKGKRSALSTMAGRTSAYWQPLAAGWPAPHRFGVRIRVGPTPGAGPLHACLHQLLREPDLALAARGEPQRLLVLRVPALVLEAADGAGGAGTCAASAPSSACARSRDTKASTSLSSASTTKGTCAASSRFVRLRIAADERFILEHRAPAGARDESR